MAAGELIGCFGLTEPDHGSDPASMATRARRDGADWVLDGGKMWITNAPIADVAVIWARAEEGVVGFAVPTDTPGFAAREIKHKMSLRASSTGEITLDERAAAGRRPGCPTARGLKAPLSCLTEARFGIIWGALGAARDCLRRPRSTTPRTPRAVRPADRRLPAHPGQVRRHGPRAAEGLSARAAPGPPPTTRSGCAPSRSAWASSTTCARPSRSPGSAARSSARNGISGEYPVMRHANNLESVLTYEGTSEIHQLVIGQKLTGLNAFAG